jgi:hypothetical protein
VDGLHSDADPAFGVTSDSSGFKSDESEPLSVAEEYVFGISLIETYEQPA